jgi:hypothetical protein
VGSLRSLRNNAYFKIKLSEIIKNEFCIDGFHNCEGHLTGGTVYHTRLENDETREYISINLEIDTGHAKFGYHRRSSGYETSTYALLYNGKGHGNIKNALERLIRNGRYEWDR